MFIFRRHCTSLISKCPSKRSMDNQTFPGKILIFGERTTEDNYFTEYEKIELFYS